MESRHLGGALGGQRMINIVPRVKATVATIFFTSCVIVTSSGTSMFRLFQLASVS